MQDSDTAMAVESLYFVDLNAKLQRFW